MWWEASFYLRSQKRLFSKPRMWWEAGANLQGANLRVSKPRMWWEAFYRRCI